MIRRARHNLPADLTRFLGREAEMAAVQQLLGTTRLLTLSGSAGVGKTRLALKVATVVVDQYRDGVWFVELAPLVDHTLVPNAVAVALAVAEQPGRPLEDSLVDALRSSQILLILDNCEHLVQASADLVETLLRTCPEVRVLTTSRQSLRVPGETTWRVPSMGLPSSDTRPDKDSLISYDATRLFLERAHAALPGLVVNDPAASTIARICSGLDGIPLAIELAAARLTVLSLGQIDQRLSDRFRLLTEGQRTGQPRQQTLRATLDWSFELLSEKERALLSRLAVFVGGWSLEGGEAVGRGSSIKSDEVLDLLGGLIDKCLVVADEPGATKRYRLLEMVRQYGWEKLRSAGDEGAVRDRHRDWILALVEKADQRLPRVEQVEWLNHLELEHDNIRAALTWCLVEERDGESGLRLAGALAKFWDMRAHYGEGRRWLDLALAARGGGLSPFRPRALNGAGFLMEHQCDYPAAAFYFADGLRLARELADEVAAAWALHGLGRVALGTSDFEMADALFGESLAYFRDRNDASGCASTLHYLADILRLRGDFARAAALDLEALESARQSGDAWSKGWILAHLGNVVFLQGDVERARELLHEGLSILIDVRDPHGTAVCLMGFTGLAGARGLPERAARLFGAAEALHSRIGAISKSIGPSAYQRGLDAARAALGAERFGAAAAEGRAMTIDQVVAYALGTAEAAQPPLDGPEDSAGAFPLVVLTAREREVAALVAEGRSNRAIADALVIAPRTVDTHVSNILSKLDLHSRAQIAAWSVEQSLLTTIRRQASTAQST